MPFYEYYCEKCGKNFEEYRSYIDRNYVFCCGEKATKYICRNPQISKDLLWNFDTELGGRNTHIYSKKQYKKLLKNNGLVDVSLSESKSVKVDENRFKNKLKKLSHRIQAKVSSEGLTKHLNPLIKKVSSV